MFDNIITCNWENGQTKYGVNYGATEIKDYIYNKFLDFDYRNYIDIDHSTLLNEEYHKKVYDENINVIGNTLCIGGDHSIAIGSVLSSLSKNKDTCVIWIDAHPDIHTFDSSSSKNIHGMPLSFITGLENKWSWTDKLNKLNFKNLFYFGIRDIDDFELNIIEKYKIRVLQNIDEIKSIFADYNSIHISFDVDSLDPSYMPSTGTRSDFGIELSEILYLFGNIKDKFLYNKLVNFDIVEYNPSIGTESDKQTSKENIKLIIDSLF